VIEVGRGSRPRPPLPRRAVFGVSAALIEVKPVERRSCYKVFIAGIFS
jgi:hypothetical protein